MKKIIYIVCSFEQAGEQLAEANVILVSDNKDVAHLRFIKEIKGYISSWHDGENELRSEEEYLKDGLKIHDRKDSTDEIETIEEWILDEDETYVRYAVIRAVVVVRKNPARKESLIRDIREFVGEGGLVAFEHGFKPSVNMYSVDENGIHRTVPDGSGGKKHSFVPFEEMDENTIKEIIINLFRYLNYCHLYA